MKKLFGVLLSSTLVLAFIVNAHAGIVTRKSVTAYVGGIPYWAEADFSGNAVIGSSSTMKCVGGSLTNIRGTEGAGQASVNATLNSPSNYNVYISRTVYNTSEIVN